MNTVEPIRNNMHCKLAAALSILLSCSLAFALPGGNSPHPVNDKAANAVNAGPPALPPGPNVFQMIATSTELSTNLQGMTIAQMVSANNESSQMNTFEIVSPSKKIHNSMLFMGQLTSTIALQLQAMGMPPQTAQIAANIIVTQGMIIVSMSPQPKNVLTENQLLMNQLAILSDVQIQIAAEQAALQVSVQGQSVVNQAMAEMMELTAQLQETAAAVAQVMASMVGATKV